MVVMELPLSILRLSTRNEIAATHGFASHEPFPLMLTHKQRKASRGSSEPPQRMVPSAFHIPHAPPSRHSIPSSRASSSLISCKRSTLTPSTISVRRDAHLGM